MSQDLLYALLLPLPPWLGFLIFRKKGRVGLSYGYFLGGILAVLSLPWPEIAGYRLPSAFMGGALFGFTLFLQAHREGPQGLRRLAFGVGGATVFSAVLALQIGLSHNSFVVFWVGAVYVGLLWLLFFDLGYRLTRGRLLPLRMPLVGGIAMLIGSLTHHYLPLNTTALQWWASLLAGVLLGLVALQQLLWLREQGIWVEGRGDGFKMTLAMLEKLDVPENRSLAYGIEAQQPMLLVNEKGEVLESNGPFGRLVGMPRHQLLGYDLVALFQGQDRTVWEDLRSKLQKDGRGRTDATLVSQEGAFQDVVLEAAPFDRNMALVWVAGAAEGALALRSETGPALETGDSESVRREMVNALGAIQPAAEQILKGTQEESTRRAAELILMAAGRLQPGSQATRNIPPLEGDATLHDLLPKLQKMMPAGIRVDLRAVPLSLRIPKEALERIATHLALHGRQVLKKGTVILTLEAPRLGGRRWGLLGLELDGDPGSKVQNLLGLAWMQDEVRSFRGMLELSQEPGGNLWPSVFMPLAEEIPEAPASPLLARRIWIVDQDPLVQEALSELVQRAGGEALTFWDLKDLLKASRSLPAPHLLVLERTPRLERFQRAMRGFQREPIPTVVMGNGHAVPVSPLGLGLTRIGFLQKPFSGQEFIQTLLALLQASRQGG